MDMSLSKFWKLVIYREAWYATVHGITKSRTQLSNWTELNWGFHIFIGTTEEYNYFKIPQYLAMSLLSGEVWIFTVLDKRTVIESYNMGMGK